MSRTNKTAGSIKTIGVILVHGLGKASPGDIVEQVTDPLVKQGEFSASEEHNYVRVTERIKSGVSGPISTGQASEPFISVSRHAKQYGRLERSFVFSELFWADLHYGGGRELPPALALVNEIMSGHYIYAALTSCRGLATGIIYFI